MSRISESMQQGFQGTVYEVRRSVIDDIQAVGAFTTEEALQHQNLVFDNPNLLGLLERCFLSLTILEDGEVVGLACLDDYPVGLRGMYDNKHYNLWEQWLGTVCNLEGLPVNSNNTLWMSYLQVKPNLITDIENLTEQLLHEIYIMAPQLDGILFLKRGEATEFELMEQYYRTVKGHFLQLNVVNRDVLKNLLGINHRSRFYYSPKSHVVENLQIRMAREQDHDDLAKIFNEQSEVLTEQFGEFFIADLIATQNLTRRMARGHESSGKAIVGQVAEKAIGLISVSTEIDYTLLNKEFELETYEHLVKSDFLDAVNKFQTRTRLEEEAKIREEEEHVEQLIREERMKCLKAGQRMMLQQFCLEKESEIKMELETLESNKALAKQIDIPEFTALLQKWTNGFNLSIPGEIFLKYPDRCRDLSSLIMSPSEFLIETLELFGLPENYMKKEGHFKDYAQKIKEENLAAELRRPKKQVKKNFGKKGGKNDKKEDQMLKLPSYFDTTPFAQAFSKFVSVGAQIRTLFRLEIKEKDKKILMLFCDQNGEMVEERKIDLNSLGKVMTDNGITVSQQVTENMCSMLEAFGEIGYNQIVVKMQEKIDQKKTIIGKKANEIKMIDVVQKLVSHRDFEGALLKMEEFDLELAKLGAVKSPKLEEECRLKAQMENENKKAAVDTSHLSAGKYETLLSQNEPNTFPTIPMECHNAIVINLFCIDKKFESRSLEFVEYAFGVFPDRDYIIITQPFTVAQNALVRNFIQVARKKNSTFEHCLYIYHKDSLFAKEIRVRRSEQQDLVRAKYLMGELINRGEIEKDIKDSIKNPSSQYYSFTACCTGQVVGIYTVSKTVNLDYYVSHFFVQDQIMLQEHPRDKHAKVIHSLINPLFSKSVRFILKQILRFTNKTCLYFEVHNRTLLPDVFNEFTPLRMRSFPHLLKRKWNFSYEKEDIERRQRNIGGVDMDRDVADQTEAAISLSMLTKRDLSSPKLSINTRIVVVGASDTGVAFIESLLMIKDVNFTNITLLSPGGIITMHVKNQKDYLKCASTSYTLDELRNLMIDARTTVLDAKMVQLKKKERRILIDKKVFIPYDVLILSVGLIDTQLQKEGLISCGLTRSPYYKSKPYIGGVYSIDDPYLYQSFAANSPNCLALKRKKKPQNITIYGRTPHTIAFISGLIARGVLPQRIYYVCPNSARRRTQTFESNEKRIEYDSQLINDPDTFEDINAQKMVIDYLRLAGVHVQLGFEFHQIEGNPCTAVKFRKKADNYDEIEQLIKRKRIEIQQKLQQMGNKLAEEIEEDDEDLEEKISPEKEIQILQQQQWKQLVTPSSFLVTSGLIDIDKQIFNIIHENGLVYNGRLIIKSNFQTTENEIFACGKICEFSQRYKNHWIGRSLRLDRYNGRQLGAKLSKYVLEWLNLGHLAEGPPHNDDQLPKFTQSIGLGSALAFNSMVYYFIKRTDNTLPKQVIQAKTKGVEIISKNLKDAKGHYLKFSVDPNGMIESASYLGSEDLMVPSLSSFIGLNVSYLNKVGSRNDAGLITDMAQFLSQNWAICLYHEMFQDFREYVKQQMMANPIAERMNVRAAERASQGKHAEPEFMAQVRSMLKSEMVEEIRQGTIEFVSRNKNHLPMYYLPKKKVQVAPA